MRRDASRCRLRVGVAATRQRGTPHVGVTSSARVPMWWQTQQRGQTIHIETAPKEPAHEGALRQREAMRGLAATITNDDGRRDIVGDDARGVADDAPRCCLLVSTPRRECSEVKCMLEPSFNSILRSGQHSTSRSGRHLKANATPRPGAAHIVLLDRSGRPPV